MISHDGSHDPIHQQLRRAIEKPERSYLWTPANTITFTPHLLPVFYGDGRALFTLTTIHQRPRYWVIRACSTWGCGLDSESSPVDFVEFVDDIVTDLEDAFGRGRCGYSGQSLFWPRNERMRNCQCEECSEKRWKAHWPMVDDRDGTSWTRLDWPSGFATVHNRLSWRGALLDPALAALPADAAPNARPPEHATAHPGSPS